MKKTHFFAVFLTLFILAGTCRPADADAVDMINAYLRGDYAKDISKVQNALNTAYQIKLLYDAQPGKTSGEQPNTYKFALKWLMHSQIATAQLLDVDHHDRFADPALYAPGQPLKTVDKPFQWGNEAGVTILFQMTAAKAFYAQNANDLALEGAARAFAAAGDEKSAAEARAAQSLFAREYSPKDRFANNVVYAYNGVFNNTPQSGSLYDVRRNAPEMPIDNVRGSILNRIGKGGKFRWITRVISLGDGKLSAAKGAIEVDGKKIAYDFNDLIKNLPAQTKTAIAMRDRALALIKSKIKTGEVKDAPLKKLETELVNMESPVTPSAGYKPQFVLPIGPKTAPAQTAPAKTPPANVPAPAKDVKSLTPVKGAPFYVVRAVISTAAFLKSDGKNITTDMLVGSQQLMFTAKTLESACLAMMLAGEKPELLVNLGTKSGSGNEFWGPREIESEKIQQYLTWGDSKKVPGYAIPPFAKPVGQDSRGRVFLVLGQYKDGDKTAYRIVGTAPTIAALAMMEATRIDLDMLEAFYKNHQEVTHGDQIALQKKSLAWATELTVENFRTTVDKTLGVYWQARAGSRAVTYNVTGMYSEHMRKHYYKDVKPNLAKYKKQIQENLVILYKEANAYTTAGFEPTR